MRASFFIVEFSLLALALLILMLQAFEPVVSRRRLAWLVIGSLSVLLAISSSTLLPGASFQEMTDIFLRGNLRVLGTTYRMDAWTLAFRSFFLMAGLGLALISLPWLERMQENVGEYLALLVLTILAMVLTAGVADFAMLFVVLELLTISSYILVSFLRKNALSLEAGIKYLIIGAAASAMMVYGITLVYGVTGSLQFEAISESLRGPAADSLLVKLGLLLVITGLCFKIGAFPFHWWVPDVYQGAPMPTTAMLSVGSKAAGFVLLIRVLHLGFQPLESFWQPILCVMAAATILFGNFAAMGQNNLKRLMGYSSISHAGYMLLGVAAASMLGQQALVFYLYAYLFGSLLVFGVMAIHETPASTHEISEYSGLRDRSPWLAAALIVGLVSLAGIPPLVGFFGKFLLLIAILEAHLYWLAAIMLLGVLASLYYYLRVVRTVYFDTGDLGPDHPLGFDQKLFLASMMALVIIFGIFQNPIWYQATANWLQR